MQRSVVFVHGTGVREASYRSTFATVRAELGRLRPGWEVRGCLWGPAEGAAFVRDGASVPGYPDSGGGRERDTTVAEWAVLYDDPGYELRLLGLRPAPTTGMVRGVAPARRLVLDVREFQPSPELLDRVERLGLRAEFDEALRAVADSPELRDAAATVSPNGYEHRLHGAAGRRPTALGAGPAGTGHLRDAVGDDGLAGRGTPGAGGGHAVGRGA